MISEQWEQALQGTTERCKLARRNYNTARLKVKRLLNDDDVHDLVPVESHHSNYVCFLAPDDRWKFLTRQPILETSIVGPALVKISPRVVGVKKIEAF